MSGWTGLVAKFIQLYGLLDPKRLLEGVKRLLSSRARRRVRSIIKSDLGGS